MNKWRDAKLTRLTLQWYTLELRNFAWWRTECLKQPKGGSSLWTASSLLICGPHSFFFHADFIFIVGNFCISCLFCGLHDILLSFARTSSKCQFHAGSTKCSKRNVICSGIYEIDLHVEVKPPVKPLVNLGKQIVLYLSKNKLDDETK